MQVRSLIQKELISTLESFDALISPVAPSVAWKLGEIINDPLAMYKSDIMTVNLNLSGKRCASLRATLSWHNSGPYPRLAAII